MRAHFCRSASGTWARTPLSSTCTAWGGPCIVSQHPAGSRQVHVLGEALVGDFGTARTYRLAISEVLKSGVPVRQPELLRAHLWAPRYSASSAELAETVGYNSWRIANFQYGALA